jgi:pSer/pThr/pTyr-binding forkhead associated (FHA) protein
MQAHLELWTRGETNLFPLSSEDVSIGRAETNDVSLTFDPMVSRLHAVIVRYRGGWCLRDVGSANGTSLNGRRVLSEQLLRSGDEIRVGSTRIVFRASPGDHVATNATVQAGDRAPLLTRRERDVLVALCRPLLGSESFAQPASNQEIARELTVSEAGVKFHLANLYDKFAIGPDDGSKRARLANEALRRGVVTRSDLTAD